MDFRNDPNMLVLKEMMDRDRERFGNEFLKILKFFNGTVWMKESPMVRAKHPQLAEFLETA